MLKKTLQTGLGFGVTSGVITTLGLITGLYTGTYSKVVVIGGVLSIALSDALSDSFGLHMSKEFDGKSTKKEIWQTSITAFFTKLVIASSFLVPTTLLPLKMAVIFSIIWGILLLAIVSCYVAKEKNLKPLPIILEHFTIAAVVLVISSFTGYWLRSFFLE